VMSARGGATLGGVREEATPVGLKQILVGQKIKKIHTVDLAALNGW
jgi:hypothetical protein